MIIPSAALARARDELGARLESGKTAGDEVFEEILAVDPYDYVALIAVGQARQNAGDLAAAEQYYWRSLDASPCSYEPYVALSQLLMDRDESSALAAGLFELGIRKVLANDDVFEEFLSTRKEDKEFPTEPFDFRNKEDLEAFVAALAAQRTTEPRDAADRLRPYRLIHELQVSLAGGGTRELVDRIVAEGESCWPLLVGVLRGWYNDQLPEDADGTAVASLALLGEIGNPAALPALVEFCGIDEEALGEAANWAIERIASRRAAETIDAFRKLAPGADVLDRCAIAQHLLTMPEAGAKGDILLTLLENFEGLPKDGRDSLFLTVALCFLATQGPQGPEMLAATLKRCSSLLKPKTRTSCKNLLGMQAGQPLAKPPASRAIAASVYDLCGDRDEEEAGQVPALPGNPSSAGREPAPPADDTPSLLRKRISSFMERAVKTADFGKALSMFFGKAMPRRLAPGSLDENAFFDWVVHDFIVPGTGRTVIEEFLQKNESTLSEHERRVVSQLAKGRYALVEVREVQRGVGFTLNDLLAGETFFVYDKNASSLARPSDCLLVRVEELDSRKTLTGAALKVPPSACQPLRDWILADRKKSWFSWPQYLRNNSHRIRQKALELGRSR